MIDKDGGGHSCYEGGIELMGVPPVPPNRENPGIKLFTQPATNANCLKSLISPDKVSSMYENCQCYKFYDVILRQIREAVSI